MIKIYDCKNLLHKHTIGLTYVVGKNDNENRAQNLYLLLHKFCFSYKIDGSDKRHFDNNVRQENL